VFHSAAVTEAPMMSGRQVRVVAGANSAGQDAILLARYAAKVTLLVRGDGLGETMSADLIKEIEAASNIAVRRQTQVVGVRGTTRLEGLIVQDSATGASEEIFADAAFVLIGASPHTDRVAHLARDANGFLPTGQTSSTRTHRPQRGRGPAVRYPWKQACRGHSR
jgi:thioredoxin reductase (NADPH)